MIEKRIDGVLGIQTRGGRMAGVDKSTELCLLLRVAKTFFLKLPCLFKISYKITIRLQVEQGKNGSL